MQITRLAVRNFRCFQQADFAINGAVVLFEGGNGVGKTSLLEAMHYACYLKSFRVSTPKDLLRFDQPGFSVALTLCDELGTSSDIQVNFSGGKRVVKIDERPVRSFKDLMKCYRVVTVTEDDLGLVRGTPDVRRDFIDGVALLDDFSLLSKIRLFRKVLANRNALLQVGSPYSDTAKVWTEQLWEQSSEIRKLRIKALKALQSEVNTVLKGYFDPSNTIQFEYRGKNVAKGSSFGACEEFHKALYEDEIRWKRSLFGVHLDDFTVVFKHRKTKLFASRGQQKMIILLMKIAQVKFLGNGAVAPIFLLDDFMGDLDENIAGRLIDVLLDLGVQLMFTAPVRSTFLAKRLKGKGLQKIPLTH